MTCTPGTRRSRSEARIAFDPATTSTTAITEAIEDEGYQVAATEQ